MKKIFIKNCFLLIFHFFSMLGYFIKNYNITKRKLFLGSVIISLTTTINSCGNHTHKCYSAVEVNNPQTNDTLK